VKSTTSEKKKLSFKEQKELETIDAELPKLEARKTEIETLLASGITDVKEIEKLSSEFTQISNQIDEKTMRWLELQD
jgi:ATP-binding cassette subfamily F protein uup